MRKTKETSSVLAPPAARTVDRLAEVTCSLPSDH